MCKIKKDQMSKVLKLTTSFIFITSFLFSYFYTIIWKNIKEEFSIPNSFIISSSLWSWKINSIILLNAWFRFILFLTLVSKKSIFSSLQKSFNSFKGTSLCSSKSNLFPIKIFWKIFPTSLLPIQFFAPLKDFKLVISYTNKTPSALWKKLFVIEWNRSCPAVSHICNFILRFLYWNILFYI